MSGLEYFCLGAGVVALAAFISAAILLKITPPFEWPDFTGTNE